LLAYATIISVSSKGSDLQETTIDVGTYNVRSNRQRNSEIGKKKRGLQERLWENSRDIVAQLIVDAGWDIFGV
jgi:hypothetical protein